MLFNFCADHDSFIYIILTYAFSYQTEAHSSSPLTLTSPIAKKVRRNRLATSKVWNHFHGPDENDEAPIAVCVHCGKEYLCRSFHGTSNLWKHLRFQCPMAPLKDRAMRKKEHGTPIYWQTFRSWESSSIFILEDNKQAMPFRVFSFRSVKHNRLLYLCLSRPMATCFILMFLLAAVY